MYTAIFLVLAFAGIHTIAKTTSKGYLMHVPMQSDMTMAVYTSISYDNDQQKRRKGTLMTYFSPEWLNCEYMNGKDWKGGSDYYRYIGACHFHDSSAAKVQVATIMTD